MAKRMYSEQIGSCLITVDLPTDGPPVVVLTQADNRVEIDATDWPVIEDAIQRGLHAVGDHPDYDDAAAYGETSQSVS